MPIHSFVDKTAVITGGASGIGLALAEQLARHGCRLALVDLHVERLRAAQQHLAQFHQSVTLHECDVSDAQQVMSLPKTVSAAHGQIHLLINNAGVSLAGRFLDTSLEDFEWVMRVNFWGAVYGCKAFLPELLKASEAHIVTICSSFGLLGMAGKSGYSASKFALRGFSEALRMELAETTVGLTVVYPGPVMTNLLCDGRATNEQQRQAEISFLASRAIPASRVAKETLRGIQQNKPRVRLSLDYAVIDWLTRFAPATAQRWAAWVSRKMPF